MVFSRGLVISLGVSALSATLLFLYFRNRMASVERKVDVMFDLIQSHEVDRQQQMNQQMMPQQDQANQQEQSVEQKVFNLDNTQNEPVDPNVTSTLGAAQLMNNLSNSLASSFLGSVLIFVFIYL